MKEIKFLKDLPIKYTNTNKSVLSVIGGDIYYDTDGNRYGYISFQNLDKSPIFSLQLFIREYTIDGKFIKDNEYFEAYTYYPKGSFVINEPILLDKETEALSVTVVKITLNNRNFIDDKFVAFKQEDYINIYQRKAPVKKRGTGGTFVMPAASPYAPQPEQAAPAPQVEEPVKEEAKPVEQPEVEEKPVEQVDPSSFAYSPIRPTVRAEAAKPVEEKVEEKPAEEAAPQAEEQKVEKVFYAKRQKALWSFIPAVLALAIIVILTIVIINAITGGVNAFNSTRYR